MNIYFLKNMLTGRYDGDDLEPYFEKTFFVDYDSAREAAWARNCMHRKDLTTLDKYVVEVKEMSCPIMYVRYDEDCMRRFFNVRDAIHFYEEVETAYEIGYFSQSDIHPLDLTKDQAWTENYVHCEDFDNSFWNSKHKGDFEQTPGQSFNTHYIENKTINISNVGEVLINKDLRYDNRKALIFRYEIKDALKNHEIFTDKNGIQLTVRQEYPRYYYEFGGSFTGHVCSWWYPNGRLFMYTSLYAE